MLFSFVTIKTHEAGENGWRCITNITFILENIWQYLWLKYILIKIPDEVYPVYKSRAKYCTFFICLKPRLIHRTIRYAPISSAISHGCHYQWVPRQFELFTRLTNHLVRYIQYSRKVMSRLYEMLFSFRKADTNALLFLFKSILSTYETVLFC